MKRWSVLSALILAGPAIAQTVPVPNASFEQGTDAPASWKSTGSVRWLSEGTASGARAIAAVGTGKDNTFWHSAPLKIEPRSVYLLRFKVRSLGATGGTAVTGPTFCNRDLGTPPATWTEIRSHFTTPTALPAGGAVLRFGQWHVNGTVAFDDVQLVRAEPVHARFGEVVLGEGESLTPDADGACEYAFLAPLGDACGNTSRPLAGQQCQFNSNRWCLDADSEVVYRHDLAGRKHTRATVDVGVPWHAGGELLVEASTDGKKYRPIGTLAGLGDRSFDVPLPTPQPRVWIRLRARAGAGKRCSLQVSRYGYTARLTGPAVTATGQTHFVALPKLDGPIAVAVDGLGDGIPGGHNALTARITNRSAKPIAGELMTLTVAPDGAKSVSRRKVTLAPGETTHKVPYRLNQAGEYTLRLTLAGPASFTAETDLRVPMLHDASYGESLPAPGGAELWWASSGWKISRRRGAPKARGRSLLIRTAANEAEAAQLVVRPRQVLRGFRAIPTDLTGPGGATIPAAAVDVLRVRYVPVAQPTDRIGSRGDWPDPLPPLTGPVDLPAGKNQPLWVRVAVPRGTRAGAYVGSVVLTASGVGEPQPNGPAIDQPAFAARAALRVEVYGFDLPDRMTCQTAFGFSPPNVWRYQKVRKPADRRAVLEKYLANFSAHHISPYDPAPLDGFGVTWPGAGPWRGGSRDRTNPHAGKASLRVEDASPTASASATYRDNIRIPAKGVRLRFRYRTAKASDRFIVTLNHHDAAGKWMWGKNRDMRITGDGTWQAFDRTITTFPDGAKSVRLTLWPCLYSEQGKTTGTVWYDEVSLADAGSGKQFVRGGDFEPIPPEKLIPRFDFTAWDAAMAAAIDRWHFNSFRLPIQGMGGGTFHARSEPSLLGYTEDTPEYQAAFGAYCRQLADHLREKGWLDEAFVYWFDEPDPKDYAFVMNGFRKLAAAAPDLTRMLTEQVEPALVGGPNLWCPVTPHYDHAKAEERRAHGDRFWWYVCCGPKEPYCGLFIDHPATEMRVWLWQTYQRKITGVLVWATNYWTSPTAYTDPKSPQNPYDDPMGWVSGYSTPAGTRRPWGNGDGRFVYPPEAAADARQGQTVLDGPVDSIRWEMLRDGLEDYEYLAILARLLKARGHKLAPADRARYTALLTVPESITKDMTTFTTDPAPIETRRHQIAQAIETLTRN